MTSCTDPLGLNETKLFKDLKSCLPKDFSKDTRNILEIRDDILYVWNPEKSCILTLLNVSAVRGKHGSATFQSLMPIDPPIFEVTDLTINETVTQLALWGHLGIVVVELPKRWGKDAKFQGGKDVISCLSYNFDGCCSQLATTEIRKVRWHPGSLTDSHLVVLTADNVFQLYECELGDKPELVRSWKVGPSNSSMRIPSFAALGEAAVDFDFATPAADHNDNDMDATDAWRQIEWPILVLRGNGDVLLVRGNVLIDDNKPVVFGSLSMYPPAFDNYGTDSCSILCLQTTPPLVVIASCLGKIYHAVLLTDNTEEEEEEKKTWSQYGSTYSLHTPDEALFVFESIEMELGLFYADKDKKYSCPIHLHADRENRSRYFCSHNAGIHLVNVPMVGQLDDYVDASENSVDLHLPKFMKESSAQYLVSTRTKYTSKDETTPILGFGLLQEPCVLIALLHTGVVVNKSIVDHCYISKIEATAPVTSPSKKVTKEPFDTHVKKLLLNREASQPLTMLGLRQNMSPREYLELLYRATSIFRKQHFVHHDKVREEFAKKVRTLKALKIHQLKELEYLSEEKMCLQKKAENLAEKYEDIKDKQEELAKRAEEVLRLVRFKEPNMNPMERAEGEKLKQMSDKVKDMRVRIEQLKKKKTTFLESLNQTNVTDENTQIVLKPEQVEFFKESLAQMGKDVAELITRAKNLQDQVGL
ncbi:nuclear pore complex protein Nup88 [Copidosoma floridanum]|uniref:nuclear pore complex protein Nup88 n=1 Tax=Copidosoma floridanum TaxID=29053 RepID=UPI0006C9DD5A|nr:nuclear pore complex protein Nup88 [Copidosoma floridanum]